MGKRKLSLGEEKGEKGKKNFQRMSCFIFKDEHRAAEVTSRGFKGV